MIATLAVVWIAVADTSQQQCNEGEECGLETDVIDDGTSTAALSKKDMDCADIVEEWQCQLWEKAGKCEEFPHQMGTYCKNTCEMCGRDLSDVYQADKRKKGKAGHMSLWEDKHTDKNLCGTTEELASLRRQISEGDVCSDLYNERRLKERGFFVWKDAIPADELQAMFRHHQNVPEPTRSLCGASDVQPGECMMQEQTIMEMFPKTHRKLRDKLDGWVKSGFNNEAELGWPLDMISSEFITINSWKFPKNSSCVFADLIHAAEKKQELHECWKTCKPDPRLSGDLSLTPCWQTCLYDTLINKMEGSELNAVLQAAKNGDGSCPSIDYDFLRYPSFEKVMGSSKFWEFDGWGSQRLLSNLRAYITKVSNESVYQGWHDWHIDGSAANGRYHKWFMMVNKSMEEGAKEVTNVKVIPTDVLYAHNCWLDKIYKYVNYDPSFLQRLVRDVQNLIAGKTSFMDCMNWKNLKIGETHSYVSKFLYLLMDGKTKRPVLHPNWFANQQTQRPEKEWQIWGIPDDWYGKEALSCTVALNPGDILFFREDVWHRTQDMDLDRVSLIIDILKLTLPGEGSNESDSGESRNVY